ncbi:MAG: hypothetical protein UY39_C0038G0006 [Candidatus Kaiserbacteria bacterium GW2011_GWC2_49_12]|uniref:Uncharacterized protein n=4 Tax=Candidatus Kaiseribacteriota TaxID=1752734 RepID=A0A1F6FNA4_9BACT|nr:MAG: hypothetical protein UY39_C0038G0006 [Candidatus Kaiserbacteria bacterium GW2011_GWC2_49_12]OGG87342.1 MAG: hypothetical protein A3H15_01550 [Candidatus Kaiserbacteria bacterium RIFCSPLOWO2_12_FULL_50_28]HCM43713.1 hypothetical protein [Candidatus Kaiserbacteria bacterium]
MKMNRAYSMHAEQLKARKRESIRDPITDEGIGLGARDLSIADIFNDKREQDLFVNHFLPSQDKESARDIVELRRENRALSEQQEQFLEEARIAYNRLRAQAEQVQKHLTPAEIGEMAERDERIKIVAGAIGKEQAAKFLGEHVMGLAVTDTPSFERISGYLKNVHEIRNGRAAAMTDKRVEDRLKKYSITDETFIKAVASASPNEIKRNLQLAVSTQLTGWRAAFSFIVKRYRADKLYASFEEQQKLIEECNTNLVSVAQVLRGTLNPDIRHELQNAALEGKKKVETLEGNVLTVDDYRRVRSEMTPKAIKGRFLAVRDQEVARRFGKDKKWKNTSAAQKNEIENTDLRERFLDKEMQRQNGYKGQGLLINLLRALFASREKMGKMIDSI